MKVYVHLADGFEEIEAVSIVDVLRRAEIDVETVSIMGRKEVRGAHDIVVLSDILFEEADYPKADMIILPGGLPGVNNLEAHEGLKEQLKDFIEQGKWIGAICAAPMILGRMGLLEGKSVTCYPGCEPQLRGANTTKESSVWDGKVITSRGPGTSIDFALKVVEALEGADIANALKQGMIVCD
ncbi:MAG: DJ-1/PfpI family protein [Clostridia bacterium]|nr:DJ-1/PfpI family protein [Clostridia bacterium]